MTGFHTIPAHTLHWGLPRRTHLHRLPARPRTSNLLVNKQPVVKEIQPQNSALSGVVFKVQRTAKELRPTSVVTFLSQRREAVDEAYAGDIIGSTTHGGVQFGGTITDGANL